MVDIVDSSTRSRMMAGIKGSNTKPELIVRSLLHKNGFRFRLHVKDLPGKPDIVLPKYRAIIFIHGCFWHGHQGCHLFKLPTTRPDFWEAKIKRNQLNDSKIIDLLLAKNWRICIVWECSIRGAKKSPDKVVNTIIDWLSGTGSFLEISDDSRS
ncbi:very short patch repair endonuclease [Acinetobacter indicus]|uniref:very short patch repair endonuclease n=1 Tax=Acinetobacter indicus TaxID=756892 RepID=UPI001362CF71|nr:very short patch repair endonuclease [Acinetobacter indicus]